jgi:hypothetical protein
LSVGAETCGVDSPLGGFKGKQATAIPSFVRHLPEVGEGLGEAFRLSLRFFEPVETGRCAFGVAAGDVEQGEVVVALVCICLY